MENTNKSLKEWNAIVEALGQGLQTLIIRKYPTNSNGFLLYPTVSYALKDNYLINFKEQYREFVQKNALPKKEGENTEIKYYAKIEAVLQKSAKKILTLDEYNIWDKNHVKYYLGNNKGYVWVLRVYKLDVPVMAEKNRGMLYANLKHKVSLQNAKPAITSETFGKILNNLN
jgi:hypothetical protein